MYSARSIITCTMGMESYLQSDDMIEWTSKSFLRTPNWSLADHKHYIKAQCALRERLSCVHRIICRNDLVVSGAIVEPDFIADYIHHVRDARHHTLIGLVDQGNWKSLEAGLSGLCPLTATGWDKISVADDFLVLIRVGRYYYHYTFHEPTALKIRDHLDAFTLLYIPYRFPSSTEIYSLKREDSVVYAVRKMEQVLALPQGIVLQRHLRVSRRHRDECIVAHTRCVHRHSEWRRST